MSHVFSFKEIALGYTLSAERVYANDGVFLNDNPHVVAVFVSLLFQSLEISIKYAGCESGLFTKNEARRKGHDIKGLAQLAGERLNGDSNNIFMPVVMGLTFNDAYRPDGIIAYSPYAIIDKMIHGKEFEKTRECYVNRALGYGEVANGDFAMLTPASIWVGCVKETAMNLDKAVDVIKAYMRSPSRTMNFVDYLAELKYNIM